MAPFIFLVMPDEQARKLLEIFSQPMNALVSLPLAFGLALITAALTEEIFFRGVLQSHLARLTGSDARACLITALLFGLYHLPYAYFSNDWSTHGNLPWAVSSVLAEQMVTGVLLGFLWLRTRNIAAPVLFHALVNTQAIMSSLNFNMG